MPSNGTVACLECQVAWKGGGPCLRCHGDAVYMGTRWRAPRKNADAVWSRMRREKEAGVEDWWRWDTHNDYKPYKVPWFYTREDHEQMRARKEKAKANLEYHRHRMFEEMMRLQLAAEEKRQRIKAEIRVRRNAKRRLDRAGGN